MTEIEKMINDLLRYFNSLVSSQSVSEEAEDDHDHSDHESESISDLENSNNSKPLPGSENKERPKTWKDKWTYLYQKPEWGKYRIPAEGGLLSRHHPVSEGGFATPTHTQGHEGFDIANSLGTPIYAIGPGIVTKVYNEQNNKGGKAVVTSHENGRLISYYAHLDSVSVSVGSKVDQSTQIGTMGKTGNARGVVHLHWHTRLEGQTIDPVKIINKPVGFLNKEAKKKEVLQKLARQYRKSILKSL